MSSTPTKLISDIPLTSIINGGDQFLVKFIGTTTPNKITWSTLVTTALSGLTHGGITSPPTTPPPTTPPTSTPPPTTSSLPSVSLPGGYIVGGLNGVVNGNHYVDGPIYFRFLSNGSSLPDYPNGTPYDNWVAQWTGYLRVDADGIYRFVISADDHIQLYLNGIYIGDAGEGASSYDVSLAAGYHNITINYTEDPYPLDDGNNASWIDFEWLKPGDSSSSPVPSSNMYHN